MADIVKKTEKFELSSGTVQLKVTIGDGQLGSTSVMLGTTLLGMGGIINMSVGSAEELANKTLYLESTTRDVNSASNWTSVVVELSDGENDKKYTYSQEASANGEAVIYDITINFS